MTFTISMAIIKVIALSLTTGIAGFFVGAAYGKRVGMKGGTIAGSVSADIAKARKAANDKLQSEIKRIKAKAKEQV